jgi:hypothetical protein
MERDLRITGTMRGQSSNHLAPPGFDVSKPWKVWTKRTRQFIETERDCANPIDPDREADFLDQKLQHLFLYYACASICSSITIHTFCRNISLETSMYHTIEPQSSFLR